MNDTYTRVRSRQGVCWSREGQEENQDRLQRVTTFRGREKVGEGKTRVVWAGFWVLRLGTLRKSQSSISLIDRPTQRNESSSCYNYWAVDQHVLAYLPTYLG